MAHARPRPGAGPWRPRGPDPEQDPGACAAPTQGGTLAPAWPRPGAGPWRMRGPDPGAGPWRMRGPGFAGHNTRFRFKCHRLQDTCVPRTLSGFRVLSDSGNSRASSKTQMAPETVFCAQGQEHHVRRGRRRCLHHSERAVRGTLGAYGRDRWVHRGSRSQHALCHLPPSAPHPTRPGTAPPAPARAREGR